MGVLIDSHLTWSVHTEELRRKSIKRISILARVRKHLPTQYIFLFNANIKPLFEYCCTVWSNCSQCHLDDLFKLQERCARLILDSPYETRSFENFQRLQWLPIDKIWETQKLCLFREISDGRAPEYLINKLESFRLNHKCQTRAKAEFRLPKPKTDSLRRTFFTQQLRYGTHWEKYGRIHLV